MANRPTARDAAQRLIILKYVAVHGLTALPRDMLEKLVVNWSQEEQEVFHRDAKTKRDEYWKGIRDLDLWDSLSPSEQAFAESTFVSMTHQQLVDASWRVEAAHTIMWALELVDDLPPYDSATDAEVIKEIPSREGRKFIAGAKLRNPDQIDRARDVAELWHWRSRTRELIERDDPVPAGVKVAGFNSYEDIVRVTARHSADDGIITRCIDDDFPVHGKAYRDISHDEWAEVRSITMERHHALNWLCGYSPDNCWDETPTDT